MAFLLALVGAGYAQGQMADYASPKGHVTSPRKDSSSSAMRLWPGTAPGDRPGTIGEETEWCLTGGVPLPKCIDVAIGNVTVPTLTPFIVEGADSALVVAPGGAYKDLAFAREGTDIAVWLNSIGVSAFVLKYRVPVRPWLEFGAAPLMDAQRAMGLVRSMAGSAALAKLNASKVGFMGFSAGSHLTGHLNVAWKNRTYPRVDAADDLPCRPDASIMVYPWRSVSEPPVSEPPSGASADNVTSSTPPTMLVQAEDDPVHSENSLFYFLALKQKGAPPSELHVYPRGGHGYGRCTMPNLQTGDEVCTWPDRGARFLKTLQIAPPAAAGAPGALP
jgi:acetyl esterase/lipase